MTERKCACNKLFSILVNLAGVGRRNKFCENIISVPLPLFSSSLENLLTFTLFKRQQRLLKFGRHYMVLKNLHEN
ncbi:hypothetical protein EI049_25725 [Escherichia coli]|nr:hypothetical protein [Escherichia coli]